MLLGVILKQLSSTFLIQKKIFVILENWLFEPKVNESAQNVDEKWIKSRQNVDEWISGFRSHLYK